MLAHNLLQKHWEPRFRCWIKESLSLKVHRVSQGRTSLRNLNSVLTIRCRRSKGQRSKEVQVEVGAGELNELSQKLAEERIIL